MADAQESQQRRGSAQLNWHTRALPVDPSLCLREKHVAGGSALCEEMATQAPRRASATAEHRAWEQWLSPPGQAWPGHSVPLLGVRRSGSEEGLQGLPLQDSLHPPYPKLPSTQPCRFHPLPGRRTSPSIFTCLLFLPTFCIYFTI